MESHVDNLIAKRNKYWSRLRTIRNQYIAESKDDSVFIDATKFLCYLEETYGIRGELKNGMFTENHTIVDEAKYLFFLLKTE